MDSVNSASGANADTTDLSVLSRDFHFIKFRVLELDEVVAQVVEGLHSGTSIEEALILVPPLLQFTDILLQCGLALDEVLLVVSLSKGEQGRQGLTGRLGLREQSP